MTTDRYMRDAAHGGPDDTGPEPVNQNALGGERAEEEGPISERAGRDPSNLGDEVADAADATYPPADPLDPDPPNPTQI